MNNDIRLNTYGKKGIVRDLFIPLIQLVLLLITAGTFSWKNAWLYIGLNLFCHVAQTGVLLRISPHLLNERGQVKGATTKTFDKLFYITAPPLFFSISIIAGLDAGCEGWSDMPFAFYFIGGAIYILSYCLSTWAMAVNEHFEITVRIQRDRNHKVCTAGPYKIVRHPGYLGMILGFLSMPFILGSTVALVPALFLIIAKIIRTYLEDRTLMKELPGYREFALNTRYRIFSFIW